MARTKLALIVAALVGVGASPGALAGKHQKPAATKPAAAAKPAGAPAGGEQASAPATPVDKVKITFRTVPPRTATVTWGGKRLGTTAPGKALVVERPRDSGPMDVMIRAAGCVPVSTRAYTFKDHTLSVKVTPVDQKNKLFGYREELPPEDGTTPEGGAAPAAGAPGAAPGAKPAVPVPPGPPGLKPPSPPAGPVQKQPTAAARPTATPVPAAPR